MTQQPSQNKQILAKLDMIVEDVGKIKTEIAVVKENMKMQPQIDAELHKAIDQRICNGEKRIKQLEDNQRWIIIAVFGAVINALMQLILK